MKNVYFFVCIVEEIRHRVLKEISITELKDVDSKVLGTVKQGMVVKILKVDETRCKVNKFMF